VPYLSVTQVKDIALDEIMAKNINAVIFFMIAPWLIKIF